MHIEAKLEALGLVLPEPFVAPPGTQLPFSWVRIRGNRAYISGHAPLNPDGSLAKPLPFKTKKRDPSRANMTEVGYQPTGTHPSTVLPHGLVTSTTATVLLSALATSSLVPSGDNARLFGVVPTGALGYNATEICSFADRVAKSTTHTAFVFAHATNNRAPSCDWTIAFG